MKIKTVYKVIIAMSIMLLTCFGLIAYDLIISSQQPSNIQTKIVYKYQPPVKIFVDKPTPYKVLTPVNVFDTIRITDTIIIKKYITSYLSEVIYNDTLKNDSAGFSTLKETVYKNKIKDREFTYINKLPTQTIITNTIAYKPKFQLYLGCDINTTITEPYKVGISPQLMLLTPSGDSFNIGYDVVHQIANAGYLFKIK